MSMEVKKINTNIDVITKSGLKNIAFNQIYPDLNLYIKDEPLKTSLKRIINYYSIINYNKKQKQDHDPSAGLKRTRQTSGTNKGASRQKHAVISGVRSVKTGAPNNVKGRRAFKKVKNSNKKLNIKEKRLCVKMLLYYTLINTKLYMIDDLDSTLKTSEFLRILKTYSELGSFLDNPLSFVCNNTLNELEYQILVLQKEYQIYSNTDSNIDTNKTILENYEKEYNKNKKNINEERDTILKNLKYIKYYTNLYDKKIDPTSCSLKNLNLKSSLIKNISKKLDSNDTNCINVDLNDLKQYFNISKDDMIMNLFFIKIDSTVDRLMSNIVR